MVAKTKERESDATVAEAPATQPADATSGIKMSIDQEKRVKFSFTLHCYLSGSRGMKKVELNDVPEVALKQLAKLLTHSETLFAVQEDGTRQVKWRDDSSRSKLGRYGNKMAGFTTYGSFELPA